VIKSLLKSKMPEFDRDVLEALREPMESGRVTISRAARQTDFPARFQLVAAMNPCPCGYHGEASGRCRCTPDQVARYRGRLSGPLLDRIDLQLFVPRVEVSTLAAPADGSVEGSAPVRTRVEAARARQLARAGKPNAQLTPKEIERDCRIADAAAALLQTATERLALSARSYHRVLKVARTIADLASVDVIDTAQIAEAIRYRQLDREGTATAR
jgi:magnesium chelatase family protein